MRCLREEKGYIIRKEPFGPSRPDRMTYDKRQLERKLCPECNEIVNLTDPPLFKVTPENVEFSINILHNLDSIGSKLLSKYVEDEPKVISNMKSSSSSSIHLFSANEMDLQHLWEIRSKGFSLNHLPYTIPEALNPQQTDHKSTKIILLDLDKTLIYCLINTPQAISFQYNLPIIYSRLLHLPFVLRPGAIQFVKILSKYTDIILYSAGTIHYILDILTTVKLFDTHIKYILSRKNCLECVYGCLKSAKLINRELKDIIIVDDCFWGYPEDLDNVIPIPPFDIELYSRDRELLICQEYILSILHLQDLRIPLIGKFRLTEQATNYHLMRMEL